MSQLSLAKCKSVISEEHPVVTRYLSIYPKFAREFLCVRSFSPRGRGEEDGTRRSRPSPSLSRLKSELDWYPAPLVWQTEQMAASALGSATATATATATASALGIALKMESESGTVL